MRIRHPRMGGDESRAGCCVPGSSSAPSRGAPVLLGEPWPGGGAGQCPASSAMQCPSSSAMQSSEVSSETFFFFFSIKHCTAALFSMNRCVYFPLHKNTACLEDISFSSASLGLSW